MYTDNIFTQAFEKAELAKFDQNELDNYENSLKIYRDLKGVIDTASNEGKLEGNIEGRLEGRLEVNLEGRLEIANAQKKSGVSIEIIMKTTGLSMNEIDQL